jgi:hypothetical protein
MMCNFRLFFLKKRFRLCCNWEIRMYLIFLCCYLCIFKTFLFYIVYQFILIVRLQSLLSRLIVILIIQCVHPNSSLVIWGWNAGLIFTVFWVLVLIRCICVLLWSNIETFTSAKSWKIVSALTDPLELYLMVIKAQWNDIKSAHHDYRHWTNKAVFFTWRLR